MRFFPRYAVSMSLTLSAFLLLHALELFAAVPSEVESALNRSPSEYADQLSSFTLSVEKDFRLTMSGKTSLPENLFIPTETFGKPTRDRLILQSPTSYLIERSSLVGDRRFAFVRTGGHDYARADSGEYMKMAPGAYDLEKILAATVQQSGSLYVKYGTNLEFASAGRKGFGGRSCDLYTFTRGGATIETGARHDPILNQTVFPKSEEVTAARGQLCIDVQTGLLLYDEGVLSLAGQLDAEQMTAELSWKREVTDIGSSELPELSGVPSVTGPAADTDGESSKPASRLDTKEVPKSH